MAGDVIRAARPTIRRETKVVSDSLMVTALSVGAHIADGFARPSPAEQRDSYLAAKRALLRLESELAVARHADLLAPGSYGDLTSRSGQVARLLTGYLVYLDRHIAERETANPTALPPATAQPSRDSARAPA